MIVYKRHVFFCLNKRQHQASCVGSLANAEKLYLYAKQQFKEQELLRLHKTKISKSGCLGRCKIGPVLVIYPDNIWYKYADKTDIDHIIKSHLLTSKIVKSLQIKPDPAFDTTD